MADWKELTKMTGGARMVVEKVRLPDTGVAIEGSFDLPSMAQLTVEDQVFVAAFVKCHGSIKEMEALFGVSYPTIKNRLNRISLALGYGIPIETGSQSRTDILDRLERGEINAEQALEALKK